MNLADISGQWHRIDKCQKTKELRVLTVLLRSLCFEFGREVVVAVEFLDDRALAFYLHGKRIRRAGADRLTARPTLDDASAAADLYFSRFPEF